MKTFDMKEAKFDWRTVPNSLSVRFVMEYKYKGHTFICAETRLISESAWQSINNIIITIQYRLKRTISSMIRKIVEHGN